MNKRESRIILVLCILWVLCLLGAIVGIVPYKEKVTTCTIIDTCHEKVDFLFVHLESPVVVYLADGEIYRMKDPDLYYLYRDKVGETVTALRTTTYLDELLGLTGKVILSKDFSVDIEVGENGSKE